MHHKLSSIKKTEVSLGRSSAAEHITFATASGQGGVKATSSYERIWLNKKITGALHNLTMHIINKHLKRIFYQQRVEGRSNV
jgi:hypothetical protein